MCFYSLLPERTNTEMEAQPDNQLMGPRKAKKQSLTNHSRTGNIRKAKRQGDLENKHWAGCSSFCNWFMFLLLFFSLSFLLFKCLLWCKYHILGIPLLILLLFSIFFLFFFLFVLFTFFLLFMSFDLSASPSRSFIASSHLLSLSLLLLLFYCFSAVSISLSIYISVYLSINLSIDLSIYPSIHPCLYLTIFSSIYRSIYLVIDRSIYLSIHLSILSLLFS